MEPQLPYRVGCRVQNQPQHYAQGFMRAHQSRWSCFTCKRPPDILIVGSALQQVVGRADFALGEDVTRFVEEFAAFCGIPYTLGVDSRLSALELSLHALGIDSSEQVIVPAYTFICGQKGKYFHEWEQGVGTGIHYPVPIHLQPFYADSGFHGEQFPVMEQLCDEVLSLPMFPEMMEEQVRYVAEPVVGFSK